MMRPTAAAAAAASRKERVHLVVVSKTRHIMDDRVGTSKNEFFLNHLLWEEAKVEKSISPNKNRLEFRKI
jgi:hypothetical protein